MVTMIDGVNEEGSFEGVKEEGWKDEGEK